MDAQMKVQETTPQSPVWDLKVIDGIVPVISGNKEELQNAILACFLEKKSIPQLPEMGVAWTDFFTSKITFGELDVQIRDSLYAAEKSEFRPEYEIVNDKLTLNVTKEM